MGRGLGAGSNRIAEIFDWDSEEFSVPYCEFEKRRYAKWDERAAQLLRSLKFVRTEKIPMGEDQGEILYFVKNYTNDDLSYLFVG